MSHHPSARSGTGEHTTGGREAGEGGRYPVSLCHGGGDKDVVLFCPGGNSARQEDRSLLAYHRYGGNRGTYLYFPPDYAAVKDAHNALESGYLKLATRTALEGAPWWRHGPSSTTYPWMT